MVELSRSCSQVHSLNGSSFDPAGTREYDGGVPPATALATVSPANLVKPGDLALRPPLD